jgi:hypothetical protein
MVEKQVINQYLNNFRRLISRFLKSGVGVQAISYPFNEGAVIVVELGMGIPTKEEGRTMSKDLRDALIRTNLFEESDVLPEIPGTSIILSKNKIVILKTDNDNQWNEDAVKTDIDNIMRPVMERKNQDGGED